jgi:C1A family cysteine protease
MMFDVKPSKPDPRDRKFLPRQISIKRTVDLRQPDVIIEDQEQLGSCTSNAIISAYELMLKLRYPEKYAELSRLFVYYNTRLYYDQLNEDSGAYLRDSLKAVKKYGVCTESIWPYDISKFDDQPSPEAYVDATNRSINYYETLITTPEVLQVLSLGYPVVIAIEIFDEFLYLDEMNYILPTPARYATSAGGHAVCVVGYDSIKGQFLVKNSFGVEWGNKGYFIMPFEYIERYCFEKWYFDISDQIQSSFLK